MATPIAIAGTLALFAFAAVAFCGVNLTVGKFLRPRNATAEKGEVYECGEPVIGSSFVQFDLRFYVVALLFIVFEVEVAFFFPWAVAFGKATHVAGATSLASDASDPATVELWAGVASQRIAEMGFPVSEPLEGEALEATRAAASAFSWTLLAEFGVFFAVLMVGFAYVWSRGDLDWVRTSINRPVAHAPPADCAA
ncbi:MAG: NADH-quinone oxidoreductase subunit A [Lacipirellulaceae bacterium]